MLRVSIRRVIPEKEERLRDWLAELHSRADEVRATFRDESVRAEQAFIIQTGEGPILVYAMDAEDHEQGERAYAFSEHPIDKQHASIMRECLGERLNLEPLYDVSLSLPNSPASSESGTT